MYTQAELAQGFSFNVMTIRLHSVIPYLGLTCSGSGLLREKNETHGLQKAHDCGNAHHD